MKHTLTFALAAAALAVAAPAAHAGTYDVWSCAGPSGEPFPANGWSSHSMGAASAGSSCGRQGGVLAGSLSDAEVPAGSFTRWTFDAPKDTTIARVTIHRTASASGVYTSWARSYFLFRDSPVVREDYGLDLCVWRVRSMRAAG